MPAMSRVSRQSSDASGCFAATIRLGSELRGHGPLLVRYMQAGYLLYRLTVTGEAVRSLGQHRD